MQLKISLAQIDIAFGRPTQNLAKVRMMAQAASRQQSDWLVLPELWSTGYDLTQAAAYATTTDTGIFAEVAAIAAETKLNIIGSCLSTLPHGVGNTLTWHSEHGEQLAAYSKLHLFRLMDEDVYLAAGDAPVSLDTAWGKVGLAICYDLRFPELFRAYANGGAEMMVLAAEWPHPRLAHWRTLLQARAIENQSYVIACNRVGTVGDTVFCGHSAIIDPWGAVLVEGDESEQLVTATIETDVVADVRQRIPIFQDQRPNVYTNGDQPA